MAGRAVPRRVVLAGLVLAAISAWPSFAVAGTASPGSAGLGDPYFPKAGNGGYAVDHYDLRIRYRPGSGHLAGRTTIKATATQDLSRFDLDLRGLGPHRGKVNGAEADFAHQGQELMITPTEPLPDGESFKVSVRYGGEPNPVIDPDGAKEGWLHTHDGAVALGEPVGSPAWYPCNDYPTDKASYRFRFVVPRGLVGVGNGSLMSRRH